jgi:outer membrane protein TolC
MNDTSPSPSAFWGPAGPAPGKAAPARVPYEVPPELTERKWGLADVLDLALRNNPATRSAWLDARAAAARAGMAEAAYYPEVDLDASAALRITHRDETGSTSRQYTFGNAAGLSWLLFDFGTRGGAVDSARLTLRAANLTQNRVLQDTVLDAEEAYHLYHAAKALRDAKAKALDRANVHLRAAEERHNAGVATIADVLQARTAASQARLSLSAAEGSIEATRGGLAVAMGLPANLSFDIVELPRDIPYEAAARDVGEFIDDALTRRPDLTAAAAEAEAAEARVRSARGAGLPTLSLAGSVGQTFYLVDANGEAADDYREDAAAVGLYAHFPLFAGYSYSYNVERARAEAENARERTRGLRQVAIYQVFSAYHSLRTATQKVAAAADLLKSATQSEEVALGRYKEGVGTVLDLTTAEAALADAQGQDIQSRWEWHTSLARLAHATGVLGLRGENPLP